MPYEDQPQPGVPAQSMREYPQPHVLAEQMSALVDATSKHIESLREQLQAAEGTRAGAQAALEALNMAQPKTMDGAKAGVARY